MILEVAPGLFREVMCRRDHQERLQFRDARGSVGLLIGESCSFDTFQTVRPLGVTFSVDGEQFSL